MKSQLFVFFLIAAVCNKPEEQTSLVFFSRSSAIEKSSMHCGTNQTGMIYTFVFDKYSEADSLLYGLILCPEMLDQSIFAYGKKLKIKFKAYTKTQKDDTFILNKHKYLEKKVYLITEINSN